VPERYSGLGADYETSRRAMPLRTGSGALPPGRDRTSVGCEKDGAAWVDENYGASWATTPAGMHGVVNDAQFLDATLASAFVARWCTGFRSRLLREL